MGQVFIGHLTLDDILFSATQKLVPKNFGGASVYSACGAALWGNQTCIMSIVGENFPLSDFNNVCKKANIDTSLIKQVTGNGIELVIEYDEKGEREFIPKEWSGNYYDFAPKAEDLPNDVIIRNNVFHLTPVPIVIQLEIAKKIKQTNNDKIVTLDPDVIEIEFLKKQNWIETFRYVDYLLISQKELSKFKKIFYEAHSCVDMPKFLQIFCNDFGIKNIVLKSGEQGAYLLSNNQLTYAPICNVTPKDLTGAGDSFAGGFGAALESGKSALAGMQYGTVSASVAIEDYGFEHMINVDKSILIERLKQVQLKAF